MIATNKKYSDEENIEILKEEIEALNGSSSAIWEVRKRAAKLFVRSMYIYILAFIAISIFFGFITFCFGKGFTPGIYISAFFLIILLGWEILSAYLALYDSGEIGAALFLSAIAFYVTEKCEYSNSIIIFSIIIVFCASILLIKKGSLQGKIDKRRIELRSYGIQCDIINGEIVYKQILAESYEIKNIISNWNDIIINIDNPMKIYIKDAYLSCSNDNHLVIGIHEGVASDYFETKKENILKLEDILSNYVKRKVNIDISIL